MGAFYTVEQIFFHYFLFLIWNPPFRGDKADLQKIAEDVKKDVTTALMSVMKAVLTQSSLSRVHKLLPPAGAAVR